MVVSEVPGATTACLLSLVKSLANQASSQSDYQTIVSGSPTLTGSAITHQEVTDPAPIAAYDAAPRWGDGAGGLGREVKKALDQQENSLDAAVGTNDRTYSQRGKHGLPVVSRLRGGITPELYSTLSIATAPLPASRTYVVRAHALASRCPGSEYRPCIFASAARPGVVAGGPWCGLCGEP